MIRFPCPSCGHAIKTPDEMAGKTGRCKCGERVRIPTPNPFERAEEQRAAIRSAPPAWSPPYPEPQSLVQPHSPSYAPPTGELIFCYACRKQVSDYAPTCPKCGAVQTPESREKGRKIKKTANIITAVIVCLFAAPVLTFCLGGIFSSRNSSPPPQQGWDMEKLRQDADEVDRDPNKTILVPNDGSQPKVVPNPFPPSGNDDR